MNRQVIDIRTSAGVGDISNEILRRWSDKGYDQAVKEGNYDRSRERLNFEIAKGGKVVPVDKERPLDKRMAEMLASRGIKDPNIGRENPNIRTAVQFIFSGSHDRMTELAFGNQKVDFEAKSGNENVKRMPEIEEWAKDIYNFVARKFGEENIISFVVHLDETTAHAHCDIVPVNEQGRISYKDVFHGHNKAEYKQFILQLHNDLAEVNRKWGLARGTSKVLTGAKGHTTESYRRWLNQECDSLEERRSNLQNAISELNKELATAMTKQKSFTTMIENLTAKKEELEKELQPLREEKLAEKEAKLSSTVQEIDNLRQDKEALEQEASELAAKASASEQDWAHSKGAVMNELLAGTMMHEFTSRYQRLPDEVKEIFSDTLLEQLATDGNHVATVALALMCEYVEQATSIAQTHGGGGGGPGGGWRKKDDEDERMFARRSLAMARRMCKSPGRRKKM